MSLVVNVFVVILLTILVRILGYALLTWKKLSKIPSFPGGWVYPIGHFPLIYNFSRRNNCGVADAAMLLMNQMLQDNPDIREAGLFKMFVGPFPFVCVVSPEISESVAKAPQTHLPKSFVYHTLDIAFVGLLTLNGEKYKYHRKTLVPAFDFKIVQGLTSHVSERYMKLKETIMEYIGNNDGILPDVESQMQMMTLSVMYDTAGVYIDFGCLLEKMHQEFIADYNFMQQFLMNRIFTPWLLLDFLLPFYQQGRDILNCIKTFHSLGKDIMDEALLNIEMQNENNNNNENKKRKRLNFMEILIRENRKNPHEFTLDDVQGEFRNFIVA